MNVSREFLHAAEVQKDDGAVAPEQRIAGMRVGVEQTADEDRTIDESPEELRGRPALRLGVEHRRFELVAGLVDGREHAKARAIVDDRGDDDAGVVREERREPSLEGGIMAGIARG